jgi:arylsulfatase A-like enzyme
MSELTRIGFMIGLLLWLGCGNAEPPKHLVLITLDTLRADRLGAYGYARDTAPHFDALASRGVRFDEAITQAVLTPPSHASILTGLNPPNHGLHRLTGQALSPQNLTLAEILRGAEFTTAAFVGARPLRAAQGLAQGFQTYNQPNV